MQGLAVCMCLRHGGYFLLHPLGRRKLVKDVEKPKHRVMPYNYKSTQQVILTEEGRSTEEAQTCCPEPLLTSAFWLVLITGK